jgi:hypothetical protein
MANRHGTGRASTHRAPYGPLQRRPHTCGPIGRRWCLLAVLPALCLVICAFAPGATRATTAQGAAGELYGAAVDAGHAAALATRHQLALTAPDEIVPASTAGFLPAFVGLALLLWVLLRPESPLLLTNHDRCPGHPGRSPPARF